MAIAVVEERELLKTISWFDGFVVALANPSFLITGLGLSAGDFADFTRDLSAFVEPGHQIVFLEGGYDLEGLAASAGATLSRLCGEDYRPEAPTSGGPGLHVVEAVQMKRHEAGLP